MLFYYMKLSLTHFLLNSNMSKKRMDNNAQIKFRVLVQVYLCGCVMCGCAMCWCIMCGCICADVLFAGVLCAVVFMRLCYVWVYLCGCICAIVLCLGVLCSGVLCAGVYVQVCYVWVGVLYAGVFGAVFVLECIFRFVMCGCVLVELCLFMCA